MAESRNLTLKGEVRSKALWRRLVVDSETIEVYAVQKIFLGWSRLFPLLAFSTSSSFPLRWQDASEETSLVSRLVFCRDPRDGGHRNVNVREDDDATSRTSLI